MRSIHGSSNVMAKVLSGSDKNTGQQSPFDFPLTLLLYSGGRLVSRDCDIQNLNTSSVFQYT